MKKGWLLRPLVFIGLLVVSIHTMPAQQQSKADSPTDSANEECSTPVTVTGGVANPSRFELRRKIRLYELIVLAGGVAGNIKGTIEVMHTQPNTACKRLATSDDKSAIDFDNPKTFIETYNL